MKLIHHVDCLSVSDGVVLEWKLMDEVRLRSVTVYANKVDRKLVIRSSLLETGRCFIPMQVAELVNNYQIHVEDQDGNKEDSELLRPQLMRPEARRLLHEIRRRELVYMKAHPFGAYRMVLLLKHQYGAPCEICGDGMCAGMGGPGVDPGCPLCLGTGMKDPYFIYPDPEYMLAVSPKDDKITGDKNAMRNTVTRTFRSVFPLYLREEDIILAQNEAYQIKEQEVAASVGNAPAVYQLTCVQYATGDPRYDTFNTIVKDVFDGKYKQCNKQ